VLQGLVFNIQRFSIHDGPGIRTTVFLKGCPLACPWCHNPEGLSPDPEIVLSQNRCIKCGQCVEACPQQLPVPQTYPSQEAIDLCLVCGACAEACPSEARQVAGSSMTVNEVVAEVVKDRVFFEESGGGVTFSGGEPLWQAGFLAASLRACKGIGIHTAVDTCGLAPWGQLVTVAEATDLFLFDVKIIDDAGHREHTGVSNRQILQNLQKLGEKHSRIWLRVPVIPGINDNRENLEAIARLAATIPAVERVCLLPYHPLGEDKLKRSGRMTQPVPIDRPTPTHMQNLAAVVEAAGISARIGG